MKKTYKVDLSHVPEFARPAILAQIAKDEKISIEEIIVEVA
jgi:hypothetical protein